MKPSNGVELSAHEVCYQCKVPAKRYCILKHAWRQSHPMLFWYFHGSKRLKYVECPRFYLFRFSSTLEYFCSILDEYLKSINSPWGFCTCTGATWCTICGAIGGWWTWSFRTIGGTCSLDGSCPPCTLHTLATLELAWFSKFDLCLGLLQPSALVQHLDSKFATAKPNFVHSAIRVIAEIVD